MRLFRRRGGRAPSPAPLLPRGGQPGRGKAGGPPQLRAGGGGGGVRPPRGPRGGKMFRGGGGGRARRPPAGRPGSLALLGAGLGNPGRESGGHRHNVGAMVVEELARRHGGSWKSKFSGRLAEVRLDDHRVALLKPETYMNDSGRSVAAAQRF